MTVQPLAPPDVDLELIAAVDEALTLPCEVPPETHKSGQPAAYLVENVHVCSNGLRTLMCRPCWAFVSGPGALICRVCGRHTNVPTEWFRIVCEVRP